MSIVFYCVRAIFDTYKFVTIMLSEFIHLTYNRHKLIDFFIQHDTLPAVTKCNECGSRLDLNKGTLLFTCNKRRFVKNIHKKCISQKCKFKKSAKVGTWFGNSNIDISLLCRLTAYFIMLPPLRVQFFTLNTGWSKLIIIDWVNFCREVHAFSSKNIYIIMYVLYIYIYKYYRSVYTGPESTKKSLKVQDIQLK